MGISRQTAHNWQKKCPDSFFDSVQREQAKRTAILKIELLAATNSAVVRARRLALNNSAPEEWRWKKRAEDDPLRVYLKNINGCILRPGEYEPSVDSGCADVAERTQETDQVPKLQRRARRAS